MSALDESIIVKLSFLGMRHEEVGMRVLQRPHGSSAIEATKALYEEAHAALDEALKEMGPHFAEYLEEKYLRGK